MFLYLPKSQYPILYFKISSWDTFLLLKYEYACLAVKSELPIICLYSVGKDTSFWNITSSSSLLVLTNLDSSIKLSADALTCLNNALKVLPFLPHTQQCHGLYPFLFSVKLTSNLGLWWLQKGQWYALLPREVLLPFPITVSTKLINSSFIIICNIPSLYWGSKSFVKNFPRILSLKYLSGYSKTWYTN